VIYYHYRQSARSAGLSAMGCGVFLFIVGLLFGITAIMNWGGCGSILYVLFLLLSVVFALVSFIYGLSYFISGGDWSCVVKDQRMTWAQPTSGHDGQMLIMDIKAFVVELDRVSDNTLSFFIVTPTERIPFPGSCCDKPDELACALLKANPSIRLELIDDGHPFDWDPELPLEEMAKVTQQRVKARKSEPQS